MNLPNNIPCTYNKTFEVENFHGLPMTVYFGVLITKQEIFRW